MKNKWRTFALVVAGIILVFVGVVAITGVQCCHSAADGGSMSSADKRPSRNEAALAVLPERISLYTVPLRCPLVTGLGCGSESKPIMTKLDGDSAVAGAWLNHAGFTLAVLWKENTNVTKRSAALASAFHDRPTPNELSADARDTALKDFLSGTGWYRTAALDELSGQEADIVATRWVGKISAMIPLPQKMGEALRCKLSEEMRGRFVGK